MAALEDSYVVLHHVERGLVLISDVIVLLSAHTSDEVIMLSAQHDCLGMHTAG